MYERERAWESGSNQDDQPAEQGTLQMKEMNTARLLYLLCFSDTLFNGSWH